MNLYVKHRPQTLNALIGNVETVRSLTSMLERKEGLPSAILLTGESGTGKTTVARILANECGTDPIDVKEVNSADFRGIDTIRDIRQSCALRPIKSKKRFWIIDECHQLSKDAQNAFLKLIEDVPPHSIFILSTTEPDKLLETIKTRCVDFKMLPLDQDEMSKLIKRIAKKEDKTIDADALLNIATATGSPRMALTILEKVIDLPPEEQRKVALTESAKQNEVIDLCRALMAKKSWKEVSAILKGIKNQDPESVRRMILGYFTSVLLNGGQGRAFVVLDSFRESYFTTGKAGLVMSCYVATNA